MTSKTRSDLPPDYFYAVRDKARARWEQLEADPELAAPWHQLFKQVQSPRHVISELLQNADDAGATEASISIANGEFVFSHDGRDFVDDEFASLCRFGYSNKRSLHTIGFRGIGFKSTFSLGDEVQLRTPTLSVAFLRERFSEPIWIDGATATSTEVRVEIKDQFRQREIEKNLEEWLSSPASLLFFDSIRRLRVGDREVHWMPESKGPVRGSVWMASSAEPDKKYLVIRSDEERFPDEAVEEIRQERMISADDETPFPPCRVEIVLGMEGRLFVILPTGVKTKLPFACNAPFIQDPARVKIKDPETSPTNRWLLKRSGELAASAMLEWLGRGDHTAIERCRSYSLMPDVDRDDNSIEGTSGTIAEESFEEVISEQPILFTEEEAVVLAKECVSIPIKLLGVWNGEQLSKFFDSESRSLLSHHITGEYRRKLKAWNLIDEISKDDVLDVLGAKHLPRPESWRALLTLWAYVADDVSKTHYYGRSRKNVRILPVQGRDVLYSATEVVRLGEKRLLQSDEDWNFLSQYLLVLNQNWPRYLAEQRRKADEEKSDSLREDWLAAQKVLNSLGLDDASDVSRVIESVAEQAFGNEEYPLEDCVRIAQIAAKLGANVSDQFEFVTQDGLRTKCDATIIADVHSDFDRFVDDEWYEGHVLHDQYTDEYLSCTAEEWNQWISAGKSGLLTFVPLQNTDTRVWGREKIESVLRQRGVAGSPTYHYVTVEFFVNDWDFASEHWDHWDEVAQEDPAFWPDLLVRILNLPNDYWSKAKAAKVSQVATTGRRRSITNEEVLPSWLLKFRNLACLLDTRGQSRKPAELLRRTPETEALLDVELFVRAEDDNEHTRPLLTMLGVGDTPTGPERLLERLRALAGVKESPIYEVEKRYHRLDQLFAKCSTTEAMTIRSVFAKESLILTHDGQWLTTSEVFLNAADDDVPDAPLVHPSVQHLSIWQRIGVSDRPTADLAIEWLQELPSGKPLDADELRRVRGLLPRFPQRIWEECEHWLSLDGTWANVSVLEFSMTMQSLVAWRHLFSTVKQRTADFQRLDVETCAEPPFNELPSLASQIEDRFEENLCTLESSDHKPWIRSLGKAIARIELDDKESQQATRELGQKLAETSWQVATGLESVPYINGTPAGTARRIEALWKGNRLYVENRPIAQLFKSVTLELARPFNRNDVGEAIRACVERSPDFIADYFAENFQLSPPVDELDIDEEHDELVPSGDLNDSDDDSDDGLAETRSTDAEESTRLADEDDVPDDVDDNEAHDGEFDVRNVDERGDEEDLGQADDDDLDDDKPTKPKAGQPRKTEKPRLMDVFAKTCGFSKDGAGRYFHPDGGWMEKAAGSLVHWERYSAEGDLIQSYWLKDSCIQREPVQLDAAIWNLCERQPIRYSIVLRDINDQAIAYSGDELVRLRSEGQLTLHPANYRLVYQHSDVPSDAGGQDD